MAWLVRAQNDDHKKQLQQLEANIQQTKAEKKDMLQRLEKMQQEAAAEAQLKQETR